MYKSKIKLKHFIATHTFNSDNAKKEYMKFVKHRKRNVDWFEKFLKEMMRNCTSYLLVKQISFSVTGLPKVRMQLLKHCHKLGQTIL